MRIKGKQIDKTSEDGTVYSYLLQYPNSSPTKIEIGYTSAITPQGNIQKAYGFWDVYNAMRFECMQLQKGKVNTVKVKSECNLSVFLSDFDRIWSNLLKDFGAVRAENEMAQVGAGEGDKPKQKGRYRLTKDEIRRRKEIVKEANRIFKESIPNSDEPKPKRNDVNLLKIYPRDMIKSESSSQRGLRSLFQHLSGNSFLAALIG